MPWLYYQNSANNVINNTERIAFTVSFDPASEDSINELKFYIAK